MSKLLDAKIAAVEQLIKSISPNLSEETRSELARKILNEIWSGLPTIYIYTLRDMSIRTWPNQSKSPQRWHSICEQALHLTFGNAGLTSIKKLEESGGTYYP